MNLNSNYKTFMMDELIQLVVPRFIYMAREMQNVLGSVASACARQYELHTEEIASRFSVIISDQLLLLLSITCHVCSSLLSERPNTEFRQQKRKLKHVYGSFGMSRCESSVWLDWLDCSTREFYSSNYYASYFEQLHLHLTSVYKIFSTDRHSISDEGKTDAEYIHFVFGEMFTKRFEMLMDVCLSELFA